MRIEFHRRGLLVLLAFAGFVLLGLQMRWAAASAFLAWSVLHALASAGLFGRHEA